MPRLLFTLLLLTCVAAATAAEPSTLYTSLSGKLRVVAEPEEGRSVILRADSKQHRFPFQKDGNPDRNPDDEFHASPDDQWIFALHHGGSGLRDGTLYHIIGGTKVEAFKKASRFSELAWKNALRLGASKHDYSAEEVYAMTFFVGWSSDSARLLVRLAGGEEKGKLNSAYLYYNVQTHSFELTHYLQRINKNANDIRVAAAEPLTPLPPGAELQTLFAAADARLNKAYQAKLAMLKAREQSAQLRDDQRTWLKQRDSGLLIYLESFAAAEKEQRRLQYLTAVTNARIDVLSASSD